MKKTKKTATQNPKLRIHRESVRTLATGDLQKVQGAGNTHRHGCTVTFPYCCRTA